MGMSSKDFSRLGSAARKQALQKLGMTETFTISDTLFNKLKNIFKNMHSFWLQYFFRDVIESGTLTEQQMPTIDDEDGESEFIIVEISEADYDNRRMWVKEG
jgi:hypothetical protein